MKLAVDEFNRPKNKVASDITTVILDREGLLEAVAEVSGDGSAAVVT
jgi:hypothetical protein